MARSQMKLVPVQYLRKSERVQFLKNTDLEPMNDCQKAQYRLIERQVLSLMRTDMVPSLMREGTVRCLMKSELAQCPTNLVPVLLMYDLHMALHLTNPLVLSPVLLKPVLCLMESQPELFPQELEPVLCLTQSGLVRLRSGKKMRTRNPKESDRPPWSTTATPLRWA